MNVHTGLNAGSFVQDATRTVGDVFQGTSDFVTQANRQATSLTNSLIKNTTSLVNCLSSSFGQR